MVFLSFLPFPLSLFSTPPFFPIGIIDLVLFFQELNILVGYIITHKPNLNDNDTITAPLIQHLYKQCAKHLICFTTFNSYNSSVMLVVLFPTFLQMGKLRPREVELA